MVNPVREYAQFEVGVSEVLLSGLKVLGSVRALAASSDYAHFVEL